MGTNQDATRFLIVGTGRSGSSLLAAVLAEAGAAFGLPRQATWNRRYGAYEHPQMLRAHDWAKLEARVPYFLYPLRRALLRRRNRALHAVLRQARYAKTTELVHLVRAVHELGYAPRIIVPYRNADDYVRSRFVDYGWPLHRLLPEYANNLTTAIMQLRVFGGCVVAYHALTDPAHTEWARPLAALTGLDADAILRARAGLLKPQRHSPNASLLDGLLADDNVARLEAILSSYDGQLVPGTLEAR